ncbi:hypothetical protein PHMEG_0007209 [Phytophthora megakarya]|uniref:Ubiquitin-like protease family profile domain-containing protein n=1 Tax=Phytophthora megakarya TaxID=4795 RepID=A0A225WP89_9STRA|nr:hypothetical protein PHMEG_0007209 [Phytophthora megakarya]
MIPEQRNMYDCGVHKLYAMRCIAQYIVDHLPQTLMQDIKPLTGKCTESRASIFRDSLREELEKFASG